MLDYFPVSLEEDKRGQGLFYIHIKMEYNICADKEYKSSGWRSKLLDCNLLTEGYDFFVLDSKID